MIFPDASNLLKAPAGQQGRTKVLRWRCFSPVIEDLTSQHVATDAPAVDPVPFAQPVMPELLRVEVIDLETGVVDICRLLDRSGSDEKRLFNL